MSSRSQLQPKRIETRSCPAACGWNLRGHLDARLPSFAGARPGP